MEGGFVVCKVSQGWGQTRHQLVHPPEPALHINPVPVTPQSIPCPLQGVQVPPGQGQHLLLPGDLSVPALVLRPCPGCTSLERTGTTPRNNNNCW